LSALVGAVLEAPALVASFDDVAVMGEPVELTNKRQPTPVGEVCRRSCAEKIRTESRILRQSLRVPRFEKLDNG